MTGQTIITIDEQATLLRWAGERTGVADWPADSEALGVLDHENAILAVGVLNHFHDQGAWIHIAADRGSIAWATRATLASMFYVPFVHYGLRRVTGRVAASNRRAMMLNLRLGFVIEGREREALDGEDVLIFGMLARECRWIAGG